MAYRRAQKQIKQASIVDVARHARVSTATISRVISGAPHVSSRTRQRAMAAIKELGYEPDAKLSRFFKRLNGGNKTVAFVTNRNVRNEMLSSHAFYSRFLISVQQALSAQNYHLLVTEIDAERTPDNRLRCVVDGKVDGVVVDDVDPEIVASLSLEVPTALLSMEADVSNADIVLPHVERIARQQVEHLFQLGHRAIACFRLKPGGWRDRRFWHAYEEACEQLGLKIPASYLAPIHFENGEDQVAVERFLDRVMNDENPPTGILTYDVYAGELIRQLCERCLSVPNDMSIVGFDDFEWPLAPCPIPLTTFRYNFEAMGKMVVSLLLDRIKQPNQHGRLVEIEGDLIVRQSSGPCVRNASTREETAFTVTS